MSICRRSPRAFTIDHQLHQLGTEKVEDSSPEIAEEVGVNRYSRRESAEELSAPDTK
jgi:hypothetical protein